MLVVTALGLGSEVEKCFQPEIAGNVNRIHHLNDGIPGHSGFR